MFKEGDGWPYLQCPHCGFRHLVHFMPLDETVLNKSKGEEVKSLDLTTNYYHVLDGCRICDKDRVDQSGVDDGNVTNWPKTAEIILATCIHTNSKAVLAATFRVEFQDITDVSGYGEVGADTEIHYNATETVLTDDATLEEASRKCTGVSDTWQDGKENVGDNLAPDSGTYQLAEDYETEIHWGLDPENADAGHQYGFRVWDATNGVEVGECGCLLTIAAGTEYQRDVSGDMPGMAGESSRKFAGERFAEGAI